MQIEKSPPLLLASTSRYRAELLARLGIAFTAVAPDVDEAARPGESAERLARRLALAKAEAVASLYPAAWVIGSDQVASCDGQLLGKPGTQQKAIEQLLLMRGKSTVFLTGLAVVNTGKRLSYRSVDTTVVKLRRLSLAEIERYVLSEQSFDCAGSAKIEGLGISLCSEVQSRDPTALIGLPLIDTARLLRKAGFVLP